MAISETLWNPLLLENVMCEHSASLRCRTWWARLDAVLAKFKWHLWAQWMKIVSTGRPSTEADLPFRCWPEPSLGRPRGHSSCQLAVLSPELTIVFLSWNGAKEEWNVCFEQHDIHKVKLVFLLKSCPSMKLFVLLTTGESYLCRSHSPTWLTHGSSQALA